MAIPAGLHVTEADPGPGAPLVVIVHGAMDRSSSFGRVARSLRDVHLVRYDRRGYGRSAGVGVAPLPVHVDDLLAVLGERRAVVLGHSMGGLVALGAAARRPDLLRALVAFEAPLPWASWWPGPPADVDGDPTAEAEAFMVRAVGERIWQRLPARARDDRRAEGPALLADVASLADHPPFVPQDVRCPVVVAAGSETTWWHRRGAEELAGDLPDAELVVVEGAGHGAHLERPAEVAELVRRALAWAEVAELGGPRGPRGAPADPG